MCEEIKISKLEGRDPNNPAIIKKDTPLWELVLETIKNARQPKPQQSEDSTEGSSSH